MVSPKHWHMHTHAHACARTCTILPAALSPGCIHGTSEGTSTRLREPSQACASGTRSPAQRTSGKGGRRPRSHARPGRPHLRADGVEGAAGSGRPRILFWAKRGTDRPLGPCHVSGSSDNSHLHSSRWPGQQSGHTVGSPRGPSQPPCNGDAITVPFTGKKWACRP